MEWKKETWRSILQMNKEKLIFIFCSGLLLFILSLPGDSDSVVTGSGPVAQKVQVVEYEESGTQEFAYEAELEAKVRAILTNVEGVGEVDVMVMVNETELTGIIVSADGGGSDAMKVEISEAMEALFGLPSHKIKVLKRVKKGV